MNILISQSRIQQQADWRRLPCRTNSSVSSSCCT